MYSSVKLKSNSSGYIKDIKVPCLSDVVYISLFFGFKIIKLYNIFIWVKFISFIAPRKLWPGINALQIRSNLSSLFFKIYSRVVFLSR